MLIWNSSFLCLIKCETIYSEADFSCIIVYKSIHSEMCDLMSYDSWMILLWNCQFYLWITFLWKSETSNFKIYEHFHPEIVSSHVLQYIKTFTPKQWVLMFYDLWTFSLWKCPLFYDLSTLSLWNTEISSLATRNKNKPEILTHNMHNCLPVSSKISPNRFRNMKFVDSVMCSVALLFNLMQNGVNFNAQKQWFSAERVLLN